MTVILPMQLKGQLHVLIWHFTAQNLVNGDDQSKFLYLELR